MYIIWLLTMIVLTCVKLINTASVNSSCEIQLRGVKYSNWFVPSTRGVGLVGERVPHTPFLDGFIYTPLRIRFLQVMWLHWYIVSGTSIMTLLWCTYIHTRAPKTQWSKDSSIVHAYLYQYHINGHTYNFLYMYMYNTCLNALSAMCSEYGRGLVGSFLWLTVTK